MRLHDGSPGALKSDVGLAQGSAAPEFAATEVPSGRVVRFHAAERHRTLLTFVAPKCVPCHRLLSEITGGWGDSSRNLRVHVVCEGDEAEASALLRQIGLRIPLLSDPGAKIRGFYGNPPIPFAYLINERGVIAQRGIVNTRNDIERLIDGHTHLPHGHDGIPESPSPSGTMSASEIPAQSGRS
ncbi:MAG: TlpA family protein disulfide reductase [Thermomicrobiales bacterium]